MGIVLKTDAAKSPWEWIANNLRGCKRNLKIAIVAVNANCNSVYERCNVSTGLSKAKLCSSVFVGSTFNRAELIPVDYTYRHAKDDLHALELDGAVVGSDVPWGVVKLVRSRIGRTDNRIDLGCYVTDESFEGERSEVHQDSIKDLFRRMPCEKSDFTITREWFDDQFFADISKTAALSLRADGFGRRKRMSHEDLAKMTLDVWSEWFSQRDK